MQSPGRAGRTAAGPEPLPGSVHHPLGTPVRPDQRPAPPRHPSSPLVRPSRHPSVLGVPFTLPPSIARTPLGTLHPSPSGYPSSSHPGISYHHPAYASLQALLPSSRSGHLSFSIPGPHIPLMLPFRHPSIHIPSDTLHPPLYAPCIPRAAPSVHPPLNIHPRPPAPRIPLRASLPRPCGHPQAAGPARSSR